MPPLKRRHFYFLTAHRARGGNRRQAVKIEIKISDMPCANCGITIEKALVAVKGVSKVTVNHQAGKAAVEFDPSLAGAGDLVASIRGAGYTPDVGTLDMSVSGMHCSNCSRTVEAGVAKLPGVLSVNADAVSGRTLVIYDPAKFRQEKVAPAVDKLGYKVESISDTSSGVKKKS